VNNNGQISGYQFQIAPSAPGIVADADGNISPNATTQQGATALLYVTCDGDVPPALQPVFPPDGSATVKSRLPFSVTVGGEQVFLDSVGIMPGSVGLTQVKFVVPKSVPPGVQPVVVT